MAAKNQERFPAKSAVVRGGIESKSAPIPALLSRPEAAGILGLSIRSTDALIAAGDLPVCRFGGTVRIRPGAIESLIEARETPHRPSRNTGRLQARSAK